MWRLARVSLVLLLTTAWTNGSPPSGADITRTANVQWTDATWADDGTGLLPVGNGDVAVAAWVSGATGDLRLLLRKSDAFDENSQPVTTGVLRYVGLMRAHQLPPRTEVLCHATAILKLPHSVS